MHDVDLLFLDEPTVGLDPSARRKLLDYLKNKVKTGLTIFSVIKGNVWRERHIQKDIDTEQGTDVSGDCV